MNEPTLAAPIFMAIIAGMAFIGVNNIDEPRWVNQLLVIATFIFGIAAFFAWLNWFMWHYSSRLYSIRQALAITEKTEMVRMISMLNPQQIALVKDFAGQVEYDLEGGVYNPTIFIRGTTVTIEFAEEFINKSGDLYLAPIRSWSEGSTSRQMAKEFTDYLIMKGRAKAGAGNRSASWRIPRKQVATWLGLEMT